MAGKKGPKKKISTAVRMAIRKGLWPVNKKIFGSYGLTLFQRGDGYKLLCEAITTGKEHIAEWLIENGVEIYIGKGDSPLHLASQKGRPRTVALLLQHGSAIDVANDYGRTPLEVAVRAGHSCTAELLLEYGDAVNRYRNSLLHVACEASEVELAALLIKFGANMEKKTYYGGGFATPLHVACITGDCYIIELLINSGADVNCLFGGVYSPGMIRITWQPARHFPRPTIGFITHHIVKLLCAGLFVCEQNVNTVEQFGHLVSADTRHYYSLEVEEMKRRSVGNLNCLDILRGDVRSLFSFYDENREELELMDFEQLFPHYGKLLLSKIQAVSRSVQFEQICYRFFRRVYPGLPDLCVERIRHFLGDSDVRKLVYQIGPLL